MVTAQHDRVAALSAHRHGGASGRSCWYHVTRSEGSLFTFPLPLHFSSLFFSSNSIAFGCIPQSLCAFLLRDTCVRYKWCNHHEISFHRCSIYANTRCSSTRWAERVMRHLHAMLQQRLALQLHRRFSHYISVFLSPCPSLSLSH